MADGPLLYTQVKSAEVSLEALQNGKDASLPPLMNPAMLEASDDLTNLSHLNEPAGTHILVANTPEKMREADSGYFSPDSPAGHPSSLCAKGDIHLQWYRPYCHKSFR